MTEKIAPSFTVSYLSGKHGIAVAIFPIIQQHTESVEWIK